MADYATAAVLAAELMSLPNPGTVEGGEISYALWDIFDPTLLGAPQDNPYGSLTSAELSTALGYLAGAESLVSAATNKATGLVNLNAISIDGNAIEGLTIYTPSPLSASQEFLHVSMSESPYPAVLGLDLLGVVGLILVFKRRAIATLH